MDQTKSEEIKQRLEQRDIESAIIKMLFVSHFSLMNAAQKYGAHNYQLAAWALELFGHLLVGDTEKARSAFKGLAVSFLEYDASKKG